MNRSAFQRGAFQSDAFQINQQVFPESMPTTEEFYQPIIRERITIQRIWGAGPSTERRRATRLQPSIRPVFIPSEETWYKPTVRERTGQRIEEEILTIHITGKPKTRRERDEEALLMILSELL